MLDLSKDVLLRGGDIFASIMVEDSRHAKEDALSMIYPGSGISSFKPTNR